MKSWLSYQCFLNESCFAFPLNGDTQRRCENAIAKLQAAVGLPRLLLNERLLLICSSYDTNFKIQKWIMSLLFFFLCTWIWVITFLSKCLYSPFIKASTLLDWSYIRFYVCFFHGSKLMWLWEKKKIRLFGRLYQIFRHPAFSLISLIKHFAILAGKKIIFRHSVTESKLKGINYS